MVEQATIEGEQATNLCCSLIFPPESPVILLALLLLLATNTGFSIYLLVMRSDEANKVEVSLYFSQYSEKMSTSR